MFGRKKKETSDNPEVLAAMKVRDELLEAVGRAVKVVDRLQNELIAEYEETEALRREGG